jgi:chromosome segregation ATPase
MSNELDKPEVRGNSHPLLIAALSGGLMLALAGDGYLLVRSNHLEQEMTQQQQDTQAQLTRISDATTSLLQQRLQAINDEIKSANDAANSALSKARSETRKQSIELARRLDNQQKEVSEQLSQLKDETSTATAKLTEVSSDVSGVKTDVTTVKTDLAATQSELEKTGADLKRAMGDMGVMSGLIATNSKDLAALRELGERNYFEFDLNKHNMTQKVGDLTLTLKKVDPKRNRYSVLILADDKKVEKKDKTLNEPVQLYVSDNKQPDEIVINQIKKDEIVGYLATPKVKMARR